MLAVLLVVLAAGYGAAAGALLPRAAYRLSVAADEPWRDRCPQEHPLAGWAGPATCRECGEGPYGLRAPLPATATAAACAALAAATGAEPELAVWLLLAPFGVLLFAVDRAVRRLPDVLTLPLAGAAVVLLGGAALVGGAGSWTRALLGGIALGAVYFLLFFLNPAGMGFGDVKLALVLGVALGWYGWDVLFTGSFAGLLLGAGYAVTMLAARRVGRKTGIAFGPFMIVGAFAGLVVGGLAAG
ncbi:A24 family peptidase [Streptomyces sp. WMMC500]|uniref:prepilin peptidase n=1 Tax=Streptomyces sp. WMMC500 TaxID=3015154 RepID=UPI00248BE2B1|nr:A24 family peptidase [Streptomyces sp. WMMC500]WBB63449.1 A24 family peptidase [Streptomyces sp. WMMC500]